MSTELDRDLQTYMSYLDTVLPAITVDEVVESIPRVPISPARRRAWPALVAAAVVTVVLLAVVVSRQGGSPARVITEPSPDVTEPSPPVTVTPSTTQPSTSVTSVPDALSFSPALDADWEPLSLDPTVFLDGDVIGHVAVVPSGFVAVGTQVWTSRDGEAWIRHDEPFGGRGAVVDGMVSTSHGLVAWGSISHDVGDGRAATQAAAWVSDDGTAWTAATFEGVPAPGPLEEIGQSPTLAGVAEQNGRLIAVGASCDASRIIPAQGELLAWCERKFTVWTSVDGLTWEMTHMDSFPGIAEPRAVTDTAFGLLAVGRFWRAEPESPTTPGIWRSDDGETWVFSQPEGLANGTVNGWLDVVVADGSDAAIVGFLEPVSRVWTSTDGATWSVALEVDGEATEVVAVNEDGRNLIGLEAWGEGRRYGFDDQTWAEIGGPLPGQPITIAAFDRHYIAVGTGGAPAIWATTP